MAPFDECCVLIPSATLEDFPATASDSDACSMLAGWTVLWHPRLLVQAQQIPVWYRANAPPDPTGRRVIAVPTPSLEKLPEHYARRCRDQEGIRWVTGACRSEMRDVLELGEDPPDQCGKFRSIGVDDFYAVGFAVLQIQVMTRRLRYTSNLDEIHLEKRIVSAAQAFLDGDAETAIEALHDVFDCLSEERDHYFASDPHLIDLTLLTPSTLDDLLTSDALDERSNQPDEATDSILSTPQNVLVDAEVASTISDDPENKYRSIREALLQRYLGWAGGGPAANQCLDLMTLSQAWQCLDDGRDRAERAIGSPPSVYARYNGSTPADMTAQLVRLGYVGIIPIDFASGKGFGDEAKVIQQAGGAEIESLTAKPIDAASDAEFLNFGARLGEAIDAGEIATGLLVHWPGRVCESFCDLRRVASWGLVLGRFWKLDEYFLEGEHPYHHGTLRTATGDSAERLSQRVGQGESDPIQTDATNFRQTLRGELSRHLEFMTSIAKGKAEADHVSDEEIGLNGAADRFATAIGASVRNRRDEKDSTKHFANALILGNPHAASCRRTVSLQGSAPDEGEQIFASTPQGETAVVTVDVPANGFATVQSTGQAKRRRSVLGKLFRSGRLIAEEALLKNEFMEVVISPGTGGIQGVYSGATRGNRFSMRLVSSSSATSQHRGDEQDSAMMRCRELSVVESTPDVGVIVSEGEIHDGNEKTIAEFTLRYTLSRGSRLISVCGQLTNTIQLGSDPWRDYLAARAAVATESAICRVILRDKLHRGSGRRLVAPLGIVVDEAERQTLVASNGLPYHHRHSDRFLDTLIKVRGESTKEFSLYYGFDVPSPVAISKSVIVSPCVVPIEPNAAIPGRGWILNVSPGEVDASVIGTSERSDGRLAALVRLIQTRSKTVNVVIRFCRDVTFAADVTGDAVIDWDMSVEGDSEADSNTADNTTSQVDSKCLDANKESVRARLSGHQSLDMLVVFDYTSQAM